MTNLTALEQNPSCPDCGLDCPSMTSCPCGWRSECDGDHDFKLEGGDWSVGMASYIFCDQCGLIIDDDGRFDSDFEDNAI